MRLCSQVVAPQKSISNMLLLVGIVQAIIFHKAALCLDCYACGLGMVNPSAEGFRYNMDQHDKEAKMYNETCTLFETFLGEYPASMSKWIRPCPENVVSCFWAKGSYNGETPEFRGCAEANFVHENKCSRELQAVTVVENQKYVDVEVDLCYCDTALCNKQRNGATKKFFRPELAIAFVALMLSFQARLLS